MDLNEQLRGMPSKGDRKFIFKEGVKYKQMTGKDPVVFRLMPAYDPNNPNAATSILPFATPDGSLTPWARIVYISRFVGHGKGGYGSRKDLVSLRSFAESGQEVFCPLEHLLKTISQNPNDWGYLMEEDKTATDNKYKERASFSRPTTHFLTNVLDINRPELGVQVGTFSTSATSALVDPRTGLVFQRNNVPVEVIQQNYLLQYAVGDLTHPQTGPVLICQKDGKQGEYSKYQVILALDGNNRVVTRPIDGNTLAGRYNMAAPTTFIHVPTEQELVDDLVSLLNMRSPRGYHEYALLREAFPQFRVPEPPSAPAASYTVPGASFGGSPIANGMVPGAAPSIPGMAPSTPGMVPGSMPSVPGYGPAPAAPAAPAYAQPPAYAPAAPAYAPPPAAYTIPGMPPPVVPGYAPAPVAAPAAAPAYSPPPAAPAYAPVPGYAPAPAAAPAVPSEVAQPLANMAAAAAAPAAAYPPAAPAATEPIAPGDSVGAGFDRGAFLTQLSQMGR